MDKPTSLIAYSHSLSVMRTKPTVSFTAHQLLTLHRLVKLQC